MQSFPLRSQYCHSTNMKSQHKVVDHGIMHVLTAMQEMHSLEKRLALAQQDNWTLRHMIAQMRTTQPTVCSETSTAYCCQETDTLNGTGTPSPSGGASRTGRSNNLAACSSGMQHVPDGQQSSRPFSTQHEPGMMNRLGPENGSQSLQQVKVQQGHAGLEGGTRSGGDRRWSHQSRTSHAVSAPADNFQEQLQPPKRRYLPSRQPSSS